MKQQLDTVEDAIAAIAAGQMVVVVDDEDRENEGDLIMAASKASPANVAFMVRHTSGILCVPLSEERAMRLKLSPMVAHNDAPLQTAFTVSVDYRPGLTTGISAEERCNTIRALANGKANSSDFARPGHIFPLTSKEGGVLIRSGHTEAATDLARLAGEPDVGLLGEVVNDHGSVKRLPELLEFAAEHELRIISIADLITYRQAREKLVERVREFDLATSAGPCRAHVYKTRFDDMEHLALVFSEKQTDPALVRIHRARLLDDAFGPQDGHHQSLLSAGLEKISRHGSGILLYLCDPSPNIRLGEPRIQNADSTSWLEVGLGAQLLRDLGVRRIRLLVGRERHYVGVKGFDIELCGVEKLDSNP